MSAAETGCTVVVMGVQGTRSRTPTGRFTCERLPPSDLTICECSAERYATAKAATSLWRIPAKRERIRRRGVSLMRDARRRA